MNKKNIIIISIIVFIIVAVVVAIVLLTNSKTTEETNANILELKPTSNIMNPKSTTLTPSTPIVSGPSVYDKLPVKIITKETLLANPRLVLSENSFTDIYNYVGAETLKKVISEQEYIPLEKKVLESIPPATTRFLLRNKRYNLCPDADIRASVDNISDENKKKLPENSFFSGFCASNLSPLRYDPFTYQFKLSANPEMCLYAPDLDASYNNLIAKKCDSKDINQFFIFNVNSGKINVKDKNICLEGSGMYQPVVVAECNKVYPNETEEKRLVFEIK